MRQSISWASVVLGGLFSVAAVHAEMVSGTFVDEVVFWHGEGGCTSCIFGPPDSLDCDLDGGATTVRFGSDSEAFDYTVVVPLGTDLVVTERGSTVEAPLPIVSFGYGQDLVDNDNDGLPENVTGSAVLLDWVFLWYPPWDPPTTSKVMFFDLDQDPNHPFTGGSDQFFAVVDAIEGAGDVDVDAVQLIPEPSTALLLLVAGGFALRRWRRAA